MLAAVKGIVQGNTVLIEDDDIREYDGAEVVVTLLSGPHRKEKKAFERLEQLRKKGTVTDYDAELAFYRGEKYGK